MRLVKYKPIGTVVTLEKDKSKTLFMIIGMCGKNDRNETNDYIATRYPAGIVNKDVFFVFDDDEIDEIIYDGYYSPIHNAYVALLNRLQNKNIEDVEDE